MNLLWCVVCQQITVHRVLDGYGPTIPDWTCCQVCGQGTAIEEATA